MRNFSENIDFVTSSVYDNENAPNGGGKMSAKDILKAACKATNTSQNEGAKRIGFTRQQFSSKIIRGTLRADEFLAFLDALGVDVEFKVRETGKPVKLNVVGMGNRVKRMVDKVIYDTSRSDALANNFYADGVNKFTDGKAMELYIDKDGRYFFAEYSEWEGVKDQIIPVTASVAAAFIEKYGTKIEKTPET